MQEELSMKASRMCRQRHSSENITALASISLNATSNVPACLPEDDSGNSTSCLEQHGQHSRSQSRQQSSFSPRLLLPEQQDVMMPVEQHFVQPPLKLCHLKQPPQQDSGAACIQIDTSKTSLKQQQQQQRVSRRLSARDASTDPPSGSPPKASRRGSAR